MRFTLFVQASPLAANLHDTARGFIETACVVGHEVHRVFFYKDAVLAASRFVGDEWSQAAPWRESAERCGFELAVCISAAARRGVTERTVAEGFEIVGLGQMIEAIEASDRVVSFG